MTFKEWAKTEWGIHANDTDSFTYRLAQRAWLACEAGQRCHVSDLLSADLEAELRGMINPAYADVRGTESYERKRLLGEIDRLRAALAAGAGAGSRITFQIEALPASGQSRSNAGLGSAKG